MSQSTLTRLPKFAVLLSFAVLCACQTPAPPPPPVAPPKPVAPPPPDHSAEIAARDAAFRELVNMQDRLYRVAAPLLLSNAGLCPAQSKYLLGFTAKNKYSYTSEFVDSAASVLGLGDQLQITVVTPASGAATAGLKSGDKLVAIGDVKLPQGPSAEMQARGVLSSLLPEKTAINITIHRNDADVMIKVPLTHACAFSMELGNTDVAKAYADGLRVLVTRGMLNTLTSDEDLAIVIAGEMGRNVVKRTAKSHNISNATEIIDDLEQVHPDLDKLPQAKPATEDFEISADRKAMFMLARADYPVEDYARFWTRITQPGGPAEAYTALHPLTARRSAAMARTVTEIRKLESQHKPLSP